MFLDKIKEMTNIFIIHGAYGNPDENWIPWLKQELEKLGCNVITPVFPTPENQSLDSWRQAFKDFVQYLDKDSIVIGHSLGPAFILDQLEKLDHPIKAAFFVAPFISELNNPEFDEINKTFYRDFNWEKIKQNCENFYLFQSDNDPYVPIKKAEELSEKLGVNYTLVKNAGHFNESAGYKKFDLLLEKIKEQL